MQLLVDGWPPVFYQPVHYRLRCICDLNAPPANRLQLAEQGATASKHADVFRKAGSGPGCCAAVKLLLSAEASTTVVSKSGLTPLAAAACAGSAAAVAYLLTHRMARDECFDDDDDNSALLGAVGRVFSKVPGGADADSIAAAHAAAAATYGVPVAEAAAAADSSDSDAAVYSSRTNSSVLGNRESAFRLFEEQSSVLKAETLPLHRAVAYGHKVVVEVLLAANADPNLRCCHGYSPLLQVGAAPYS
jgi:ankyrin repeat protein